MFGFGKSNFVKFRGFFLGSLLALDQATNSHFGGAALRHIFTSGLTFRRFILFYS